MGQGMIYKLLIALICLTSSGCGGGGGSTTVQPPASNVRVLLVDNGFTTIMPLYADPTSAGTLIHGDGLISELATYTDARPVGFVPYDNSQLMPLWPRSCFTDYTRIARKPIDVNCSTDLTDINKAIRWAADNGVQVVNVRWGGCCFDAFYHAAAQYAWERGTIVVWAAGNDGYFLDGPNSPYLFVVGSTDPVSNYGPTVDYIEGDRFTSHSSVKAAGRIAELFEELKPSADAAGADVVLTEFLRRY